jgi:DNA-directed RNA polymerase subunit beta
MLTIKSDDVYGRSKAYESIIKKADIVGPKVPESFNVLVKELQGLGLKVDLVDLHKGELIDAEAMLAENIKDEAAHPSDVDVPAPEVSDVDVTEDATADEFSIIELDDELHETINETVIENDEAISNEDAEEEAN